MTKSINISERKGLSGLLYLNVTQFLGALNDNLYKLLLIYLLIGIQGAKSSEVILSIAGAVFVLPFILFSAFAGTLADHLSKQKIIVVTKFFELVAMLIGFLSFYFENAWGGYIALFLMAAQSALFGPSKYGIIPEIVPTSSISKANGLLSSLTYLAIILGTFLASALLQVTHNAYTISCSVCVVISVIGILTSFKIPHTPPAGSDKPYRWHFLDEIFQTLKEAYQEGRMLTVILSDALFMLLGGFTQLNIIPYAMNSLGYSDIGGGYLFLLTAVGIGVGALIAGKISGKGVEIGLVPLAMFGMGTCLLLLGVNPPFNHPFVFAVIFAVGVFGGLYFVPLDSYIQVNSSDHHRGQNIAANNFLGFTGVLIASALIYLFSAVLGISSAHGFTLVGCFSVIIGVIQSKKFIEPFCRLTGRLFLPLFFHVTLKTSYPLDPRQPGIVLVPTPLEGKEKIILYAVPEPRMRLVYVGSKKGTGWFYRLQHAIFLSPDVSQWTEKNEKKLRKVLQKKEVLFFLNAPTDGAFQEKLKAFDVPLHQLSIEKRRGTARTHVHLRIMKEL